MSENVIEIDDSVVDAVATKAAEKATEAVKSALELPTAEQIADAITAKSEEVNKKAIHEDSEKRNLTKGIAGMPKELRFREAVKALKEGDRAKLNEYKDHSMKLWQGEVEKSDWQNITTDADGAAIVPDPEFMAEVERLTDEYGVAARLADVRQTDRNEVTMLRGTNEISFTKVGEATAANAQKLTFASSTVALDKYIAKLIMTSEWIEDAAINVFADATQEVGRARAKLFDQLVFTDATDGLLSAGVGDSYKTLTIGAGIANLDYDDLLGAQYLVKSSARRNMRWFMHSTVYNVLRKLRADQGSGAGTGDYFIDPTGSVTPTIDGIPVEFVDVMPDAGDITANESFAVLGDLSRVKIHVKRQLRLDMFNAGTLTDAGGNNFNLIDQDAEALRATTRVKPQTRFEGAFVIVGTGTVS